MRTLRLQGNLRQHRRDDAIAARRLELEGAGGRAADARRHRTANHRARAMQSRLDGFFAEAQPLARFRRAQAFDVAQHEHRAIRFREGIDGFFAYAWRSGSGCGVLTVFMSSPATSPPSGTLVIDSDCRIFRRRPNASFSAM